MNPYLLNGLDLEHRDRLLQILLKRERLVVFAYDRDGILFYYGGKGLEERGINPADFIGKSVFDRNHDSPSNIEALRRTLRGEEFTTVGGMGGHILECQFTPILDEQGQVTEVWAVSINVTDRERHAREKDLLIKAGEALAESLDYEKTLERVCRLAVGPFADYSMIRLIDEEGKLQLVAVSHVDPRKEDLAFELHRRFTQKQSPKHPNFRVYQSGKTELMKSISDTELVKYALDPQELDALRRLAPNAAILTPLMARGHMLGVISFTVSSDSGRDYTEADIPFAEELARRMALAVDNALLYQQALAGKNRGDSK